MVQINANMRNGSVQQWPTNWFPVQSNKIDTKWAKDHCHDKTNQEQLNGLTIQIKRDYFICQQIIKTELSKMYVEAAQVVKLTVKDPFAESGRIVACERDITHAFYQDSSFSNLRKMAFILYFYHTEIYQRVFHKTHQQFVEEMILKTLNVKYNNAVLPQRERTCIQQLYSTINNKKVQNMMRSNEMRIRYQKIQLKMPQALKNNATKYYKRPKNVFYVITVDKNHGSTTSHKVI